MEQLLQHWQFVQIAVSITSTTLYAQLAVTIVVRLQLRKKLNLTIAQL